MKSGSLVVKHHTPWHKPVMFLGFTIFLAICGWTIFYWGQSKAGYDRLASADTTNSMKNAITQLKRENNDLRDAIALLERSKQVDTQAYSQVDENLKALQEEILELREEVTFYRGIVSPTETSAGLRIERFKIGETAKKRLHHFELVLTQVLKNDRSRRGIAEISFEGIHNGLPKQLSLSSISAEGKRKLEFNFKYFQKFEGDVMLPEGFAPRSVLVKVKPHRNKEIQRSFEWPNGESEKIVSSTTDVNTTAE
ncbi:MAG: hypothetical protein OEZ58_01110 [Gammaproteobacteria bacterium]|nr:hypothetical protein [Gammaproteobacteria bacterium]MDH5727575.1 hypothetical protein [Gammaproteobacteria bacterium]